MNLIMNMMILQLITSCCLLGYAMSNIMLDGRFTTANESVAIAKTVPCAFKCLLYNHNGAYNNNECSCVGFESTGGDDCKLLSCDKADTVDERYFYQRNNCTVGKAEHFV